MSEYTLFEQAALNGEAINLQELAPDEANQLVRTLQERIAAQAKEMRQLQLVRQQLAAARNKFVDIYDFAPIGYFIINAKGEILESNIQGAALLQMEKTAVLEHAIPEFLLREDRIRFEAYLQEIVDSKKPQSIELHLQRPDPCIVLLETRAINDIIQGTQYFVAINDITEVKHIQDERQQLLLEQTKTLRQKDEAHALLGALFSKAPVGLAFFDTNFRYQRINQALADINGIPPEEHMGKTPSELLPDIPIENTEGALERVMQTERPVEIEVTGKTPASTESIRHWIASYYPVKLHGELLGIGAIVIDITERKQAEAQLTDSQERLRINEMRFRIALRHAPVSVFNQDRDLRYTWVHNARTVEESELIIGKTDEEIFPPPVAAKLTSLKRRVLEKGMSIREEIFVRYDDGRIFYFDLSLEPFWDRFGDIIGVAGAALDITSNRLMTIAEREQRIWAEALHATVNAINSSLNLPEVLEQILESMARVVPHDISDIMLIENDDIRVVKTRGYTKFGLSDMALATEGVSLETHVLKEIIKTKQPIIIPDTQETSHLKPIFTQHWLHSYVGVPLIWQHDAIGFLNLASGKPGFFNEKHVQFLQGFASQAALAIRNAQLYEKAQDVAALEERQRLARDLHDAVSQILFTSNLLAEVLPHTAPEEVPGQLEKLRLLNRGALAEMRTLLLELRPSKLEDTAMPVLLEQLSQAVQARTPLTIHVVTQGIRRLPTDVHITFYRIAQESLNNIVKHAKADFVKISFHSDSEGAMLRIEDDGLGFEPDSAESLSLGLGIMKERMQKIAGTLEIDSEVGSGTIITARWKNPDPLSD